MFLKLEEIREVLKYDIISLIWSLTIDE